MLNKQQLTTFFQEQFPQVNFSIIDVGPHHAVIKQLIDKSHLRPGGTVSGPTMMGLADLAMYTAILATIGLVTHVVTTNINVNFLRKPDGQKDLVARCQLIKVGKLLAVGEATLYSQGSEDAVAHAVGTYAIPPQK